MSNKSLTVLPPVPSPDGMREYATSDEARSAIMQLTAMELTKLQLVAKIHCRHFGLQPSRLEPADLLNEAFLRTLDLTKKWRKGIEILHHLNRAMENIAGHEVLKMVRKVDLVGTQADDDDNNNEHLLDSLQKHRNADGTVFAIVEAREELRLLEELFKDDKPAMRVLTCRATGQEGQEVQNTLNLTKKDYDAISKRIFRKLKSYYEPRSQAVHLGQGA